MALDAAHPLLDLAIENAVAKHGRVVVGQVLAQSGNICRQLVELAIVTIDDGRELVELGGVVVGDNDQRVQLAVMAGDGLRDLSQERMDRSDIGAVTAAHSVRLPLAGLFILQLGSRRNP